LGVQWFHVWVASSSPESGTFASSHGLVCSYGEVVVSLWFFAATWTLMRSSLNGNPRFKVRILSFQAGCRVGQRHVKSERFSFEVDLRLETEETPMVPMVSAHLAECAMQFF
jgi:hypothetical protein